MNTFNGAHRNDLLRQERIRRNWRQKDLAEQLGTTEVTVKRWERGSQQPSTYFCVKLCTLFGKSTQELGLVEGNPSVPMKEMEVSEPRATWMVPYMRNPHFTGRDELLEQLAQALSLQQPDNATTRRAILSQPQAIKGLGGIGKTQIAVEYAYWAREQERYTHTFWINAASQQAILSSFQALAELLPNFAEKDEQDQGKLIAAVLRWMEQCPEPWLLIVDNADELVLVQSCLPLQGRGSILLTTRASAVSWLANPLQVECMGLIEGTQFLLHRTHRLETADEESDEATNVVIALDGLPLALDQAGAYMEETGCSFADYLRLYEQHRARLLARRGKQTSHYPHSVVTTWLLSLEKIEQAHPAAAELLRLCAYLSPDHIPEELLTEGAAHWPPLLQQAVANELCFNELIETLLAFSLIKRLTSERLLSLHRLVQAVQLDLMNPQMQQRWAERVVRAVDSLFPSDPEEQPDTWPQCLRYLEQVQACDQLIQHYHLQLPEAAALLDRAGVYLREHASYSLAEQLFLRAQAIAEQGLGYQHLQVASTLHNRGVLYKEQDRYTEAEPLYLQALDIREQALGPEHPKVASSLSELADLYRYQGKLEQAESLCLRVLPIFEQALGPEHPEVARLLNNLANLYFKQGKYEQAEPLYQRALHIFEQALGPEHPEVARLVGNLANLYFKQGEYGQAEPLHQRALHIWEQALGPEHHNVAYALYNLALLYDEQGKYERAEPLCQRALHIWEQAFGPEHSYIASSLNVLANLSREQGLYEQAEEYYQRALHIGEQAFGPQHPEVARSLNGLAHLSVAQGKHKQAEPLYRRALTLREHCLGPHHPDTARSLSGLARLYKKQGEEEQALPLLQRACSIFVQRLGPAHPETVRSMHDYCCLLEQREDAKPEEARRHLDGSLSSIPVEDTLVICQQETDPLQAFLCACCELHPRAWCRSADLWQAYERWVEEHQERFPLSRRAFITQLKARGCRADRTMTARIWRGIALVERAMTGHDAR